MGSAGDQCDEHPAGAGLGHRVPARAARQSRPGPHRQRFRAGRTGSCCPLRRSGRGLAGAPWLPGTAAHPGARDPGGPPGPAASWLSASRLRSLGGRAAAACPSSGAGHPAWTAARLLADLAPPASLAPLEGFGWRPITTAYVGWRAGNHALPTRLPPVFSLVDAQGKAQPAHWYFDRGRRAGWHRGRLVISDSGEAMARGRMPCVPGCRNSWPTALSLPPAERHRADPRKARHVFMHR